MALRHNRLLYLLRVVAIFLIAITLTSYVADLHTFAQMILPVAFDGHTQEIGNFMHSIRQLCQSAPLPCFLLKLNAASHNAFRTIGADPTHTDAITVKNMLPRAAWLDFGFLFLNVFHGHVVRDPFGGHAPPFAFGS